jgi:radical SAM superfamily enzyme YgiQ (UPF0313 family)
MQRKATVVHLDALPNVTPLVGGYLKAYAETEPEIRSNWDIELFSAHVRKPVSQVINHLVERAPDVIGFSVYTWNVGMVQRVLPVLRRLLPAGTQYLLGGVEVMHCGHRYVEPAWENVAVCNGEGEMTFAEYLLHLDQTRPDLEKVKGLSFYRDGQWITTEARPRVTHLDQLPSPYLSGAIALDGVDVATFETNRGCPFACEFCYWGGAIGQKIRLVGVERIKEEISLVTSYPIKMFYLVDANFGILPRDIEIAEHIVAMKKSRRVPNHVVFSSSKNTSDRVEQVSRIFAQAGLLATQPISLQSTDARTLAVAKRDNIKTETYLRLQRRLNEWGVPSHIELMWPLPGETLESFKQGINDLCVAGAQAFNIYPLLWLNNVGYRERTEELGVVTLKEDDPASGGEMVIQTHQVSYRDYIKGLLFSTGLYLLHDCRGLYLTMQLLHALGLASVRAVVDEFVDWMGVASGNKLTDAWHDGEEHFEQMNKFIWRGSLAHAVLHRDRDTFDRMLKSFVAERLERLTGGLGEHADLVHAASEFDLLSRPYVYVQTPLQLGVDLERLRIIEKRRGMWAVDSRFDFSTMVAALRTDGAIDASHWQPGAFELTIDHRSKQIFLRETNSDEELHWHSVRIVDAIRQAEPKHRSQAIDAQPVRA